jgi:HEAT repeat protein
MEVARSSGNEEARVQALQWLDDRADESFIDELVKMYQSDKSAKVRKQIVYSLSQIAREGTHFYAPAAAAGLASTNVVEWHTTDNTARARSRDKALKALLQMYDAETDEAMKSQFLFAFSQSKSKDALQKLIQVAKNDASLTMRRKAVSYLGQSRDPEAVKFLEDLLK